VDHLYDFAQSIGELEFQAGRFGPRRRLTGRGLEMCRAAHEENPEGFDRLVWDVIARIEEGGVRSPLGLLVRMVADGDHRLELPPTQADLAAERARPPVPARNGRRGITNEEIAALAQTVPLP